MAYDFVEELEKVSKWWQPFDEEEEKEDKPQRIIDLEKIVNL